MFVIFVFVVGCTEAWVMDRIGYRLSAMIYVYKRGARNVVELGLGWFKSLYLVIPEFCCAVGDE